VVGRVLIFCLLAAHQSPFFYLSSVILLRLPHHPLAISLNCGESWVSIVLVDCAVDRQVGPPQW
jgi:hypothetical protein